MCKALEEVARPQVCVAERRKDKGVNCREDTCYSEKGKSSMCYF